MVSQRFRLRPARSARLLIIALATFILLAACGTSPAGESSGSPSDSSAPSSAESSLAAPSEAARASLPPFDHGEIPAEIPGRYYFEVFDKESVIDLEADGTYVLMEATRICCPMGTGAGAVQVRGEYGVFGDEMRFGNEVAVNGRACTTGDGTYTWSLNEGMLTLTVVEDPCPSTINRIAEWESGWSTSAP